ncbi:MAG: sugar phosphate isomerase/epimerase [Clostridiales Family XIII bacterium]|jgi:sugar phosphate isomerase/epimerase|nr:sugar phosphate isomerase/epimerase [Clostridiales Family XIII bacterium]
MANRLGINLGFATNKYIEPEVWARVVREDLGLGYVQLVADLLNPFWPETYIEGQILRIEAAAREYDVKVESIFTSTFTRVNHLMNPDADARAFWLEWFKKLLDIGARLGAKNAGSHFGILTFADYEDEGRRAFVIEEGVKGWQALAKYAAGIGYSELIFEPMSVPREMANTIEDTQELMDRVNAGGGGVPMRVCLDVGHAPHPDQRDPYPWLERLGASSPVVHLQQTVLHKSNHAPFTEENNRDGIVKPEKVLAAMRGAGNDDALYLFEISHREHWDTEWRIIPDLKESAAYWRQYIAE